MTQTNEPCPEFRCLEEASRKLRGLIEQIASAQCLPDSVIYDVRGVQINPRYHDRPAMAQKATAIQEALIKQLGREAEIERDKRIEAACNEIENLRVLLPDIAATACIALGAYARQVKAAPEGVAA